jgi:glycosyltransferase involved in cell wall biosynthesis
MRVLMVSVQFHPLGSGTERQALALSRALVDRGLYVRVATARFTGLPPFSLVDGIPVDRLPHVPDGRPFRRLGKYTFVAGLEAYLDRRGAGFDVFHCHMAAYHIIPAVLVGRRLKRPVVVKVSSSGPQGGVQALRRLDSDHDVLGPLSAWLLGRASAIVAPSREAERELIQQGFRSVHHIPNGVDAQRFRPGSDDERARARQSLGLSRDGLVFGFLGRLQREKAVDVLLRAWFASRLSSSGATLCLAGDGPQETELRTLVAQQGGTSSVRFVGRVEPLGFLHALDAFVLPSHYEGLPNALLEAMASGLACVGTQIGGIVDLLEPGESGLLVPAGQVQPLALALEALAESDVRERLGQAARSRAATRFSLPGVAQRYHELYTQLTTGGGREPDADPSFELGPAVAGPGRR